MLEEGLWTLSLRLSPCAVPFDLISFDAPPLVLIVSPMDWVLAVGRRFVSPLLELACFLFFLISFVSSDQITLVGVKRVSVTYMSTSEADLLW